MNKHLWVIHNHNASQICTVLSAEAETIRLLSGDHVTEKTLSEWPV